METNIQNRNITISTKISAHQKVLFNQEAKKHNISLSEWVCSTLDLSIDAYGGVKPLEQIRLLQEENKIKTEKIRRLTSSMENANLFLEISKSTKVRLKENISELKKTNQLLSAKLENINIKNPIETENLDNKTAPVNNNYNFISLAAFFVSAIVLGSATK
jgi:hypothetical protein